MTNGEQFDGLLSGDRKIISGLYSTLLPKLESFFLKNQGSKSDAKDTLHEAMAAMIIAGNNKAANVPQNLEAYLFSICKYKWYAELKKRKSTVGVTNDDFGTYINESSVQDEFIKVEQERLKFSIMERTFTLLSETCQALLSLVREGKSGNEIAQSLNMTSRSTVNRRKFACMNSWKKFLEQDKDIKLIS